MIRALLVALLLTVAAMPHARAQGADDIAAVQAAYRAQMESLNRTGVAHSPGLYGLRDLFAMRVIDENSRLVGKVKDIGVDESGALATLAADLTRIGRRDRGVDVPAAQVSFDGAISAYRIPLSAAAGQDSGPAASTPEALAAIAPAAGGGTIISLKAVKGADVKSHTGRRLGRVEDAMFGDGGTALSVLVLENVPGAPRYAKIAIPYDPALVWPRSVYGRLEFRIEPAAAQAIAAYAKTVR